ncbi:hypothetical protein [Saccharibacillus sacchari]|uniref:Uncharacterized protein n=1 Tax=Saccharibacillus sacchari TaxID=456493 RepID=A0ACC6PDC8_9BACL
MNSLHVVQLEAKPGLLIAVIEEGRDSRQVEIPLHPATAKQRADWQRLAGRSAVGLYDLLAQCGEQTVRLPGRSAEKRRPASAEAGASRPGAASGEHDPDAADETGGIAVAAQTNDAGLSFVRTELPFDGGEAAWELAAAEVGGPEVPAALQAAAEVARTHLAFGLTLAGVDPGELADAALAAWGDGWAVAPDEAPKAAPRAASEGGGREIAEWIASAAEKGVLHEHGRLPEAPESGGDAAAPQPCDLSLLPDDAPAQAALTELRRAMRARIGN